MARPPPRLRGRRRCRANPVRRVVDDLAAEWRGRGKFPAGPADFSFRPHHQIAHDPLPLLLGAYEEYGPIFSMRLLHIRVVFMLGPGGQPLRHRRPPGELPLARVELRRPDPAARRRPADDRRRLPRPRAGDHDARLPSRAGRGLDRGDGRPRPTRRSRRSRPARSSTSTTGCAPGDADRDAGAARARPRRGRQGRRRGRALRARARLLRDRLRPAAAARARARPGAR